MDKGFSPLAALNHEVVVSFWTRLSTEVNIVGTRFNWDNWFSGNGPWYKVPSNGKVKTDSGLFGSFTTMSYRVFELNKPRSMATWLNSTDNPFAENDCCMFWLSKSNWWTYSSSATFPVYHAPPNQTAPNATITLAANVDFFISSILKLIKVKWFG